MEKILDVHSTVNRLAKASYRLMKNYDIDLYAKKQALTGLRNLEMTASQKLDSKHKQLADEYATDVFGDRKYAYWLYLYSVINGQFKEGWIPENFSGKFVEPADGLNLVSLYKTFSNVIFQTEMLPDISYYFDGVIYSKDMSVIKINDLQNILNDYGEVILKGDNSYQGKSIYRCISSQINEELLKKIGNCVIQSIVKQHKFFDEITSSSLTTIRIITVRNQNGGIEYRASLVTFGREESTFITADNCLRVAILDEAGTLASFGYSIDWNRYSNHPDTNHEFSKKQVPMFSQAVDSCVNLHRLIPHFRLIGWDVAICHDEKIKILEWNAANPGIKFPEATLGPCFTGLNWEKLRFA